MPDARNCKLERLAGDGGWSSKGSGEVASSTFQDLLLEDCSLVSSSNCVNTAMIATLDCEENLTGVKKAVKTFSWKLYADDPDNDLAKSLVEAEATTEIQRTDEGTLREQWMQMFEPGTSQTLNGGQESMILSHPTEELSQAYRAFLKCLPKGHEAKIEDGPPRLDVVIEALSFADVTWRNNREKTKAGRMKKLFSKVAVNLHKHKELFEMIPSGDKYISLIAGSISAIIKATINHEKIAESVSKALDDLSDDIADWKELLEINEHNVRVWYYISKMYVVVFRFLTTMMIKWSSKSSMARLFRSFDSEFFKNEIEDKRSKIRDLADKLRSQSNLETQRNTNEIKQNLAVIAESQANFQLQLHILSRQMGLQIKSSLEEQYRNYLIEQPERELKLHSPFTGEPALQVLSPASDSSVHQYTVAQVQLSGLRQLRSYSPQIQVLGFVEQAQLLSVNNELINRIQNWNAAGASQTLWIQGPFQVPQPSRYTQLSAYLVMTAQKADVPVLYYFCDSTTSMIDLVYTLIAQLVRVLPRDFKSEKDFGSARFETLDGSSDSVNQGIRLFGDLLEVGPYMLFVIIDGLQMLGRTSSSDAQAQELVDILRTAGKDESSESSGIVKTLFTTDGFTDALIRLKASERVSSIDLTEEDGTGPDVDGVEVGFI